MLATLIYNAIDCRIDYCNAILAGASRTVLDKVQYVLNAAALGSLIAACVKYCTTNCISLMFPIGCLQASSYSLPVSEHCICRIPVSSADMQRHLPSANRHLLAVPHFRRNTCGRQAFSVAGPMTWNSFLDFIPDSTSSTDCFRRLLKTCLFARY